MRKHLTTIIAILIAMACAIGAMDGAQAQDPSFPTRTPTPGPGGPSDPSPTPSEPGDPGGPGPSPTDPAAPGSTAPASGVATLPAGTATATSTSRPLLGGTRQINAGAAGACSDTPYIQAIERLVVYGGPGEDFGPVTTLEAEEMRPILGRAGFSPWWQIEAKPGSIGWVKDAEVNEFGDTSLVPIVDPPLVGGATPTRGAAWNPTPLPLLTCVPTPTPTATATIAATATPTDTPPPTADETNEDTAAPAGMVSAEIEVTPRAPLANAAQEQETLQGSGVGSRGAESGRAAAPTSATNLILPIAGLALIIGGIVLALLARNRGEVKAE